MPEPGRQEVPLPKPEIKPQSKPGPWSRLRLMGAGLALSSSFLADCAPPPISPPVDAFLQEAGEKAMEGAQAVATVTKPQRDAADKQIREAAATTALTAEQAQQAVLDKQVFSRMVAGTIKVDWNQIISPVDRKVMQQYLEMRNFDQFTQNVDTRNDPQVQMLMALGRFLETSDFLPNLNVRHQGTVTIDFFPTNEHMAIVEKGPNLNLYTRSRPEFNARALPHTEKVIPGEQVPFALQLTVDYPRQGKREIFGVRKDIMQLVPDQGPWGFLPMKVEDTRLGLAETYMSLRS